MKVEIVKTQSNAYQLLRGGERYEIKGAGVDGASLEVLAAYGANSIRTWSINGGAVPLAALLDKAHALGMTVSVGLDFARERHGFDYSDQKAVARQFEEIQREVFKYKDHPALLTWFIGNELNLDFTNPKVFDAVNDVAKMIKEVDPNHPVSTTLAGFDKKAMTEILRRAPALDFISFQLYADLVNLPQHVENFGYTGPYMVTEWGAIGHWEVYKTQWGAPVETTSSEKASNYTKSYLQAIQPNSSQVIGNYVFFWGQKQERTSTWYGMFLKSGERTEAVDVMHYVWTGKWPKNRAPRIGAISLDNKLACDDVYLLANQIYSATLDVHDDKQKALTFLWEIRQESTATQIGGDLECEPPVVKGLIEDSSTQKITLNAPDKSGAYRLFAYVFDGKGNAGHANIPFFVT
jgi:hypothetical protein